MVCIPVAKIVSSGKLQGLMQMVNKTNDLIFLYNLLNHMCFDNIDAIFPIGLTASLKARKIN